MATQQDIDKLNRRASTAVDGTAPIGDAAQAAARATQPRSIDAAVPGNVANTLASPPLRLSQQRPADFIADSAGNVQANTPSAGWTTQPGASAPSAAQRMASTAPTAPNLQVTPGATNPNVIDPVPPTRATVVRPPAGGGAGLALEPTPAPVAAPAAPLALPKPTLVVGADGVAMNTQAANARAQLGATPDIVRAQQAHPAFTDPAAPPPAAAPPAPAPAFNRPGTGGPLVDQMGNISAEDFARRTAAARAAPVGPIPGAVNPEGVANATASAAETLAGAPKPSLAYRAGSAVADVPGALGKAARFGAAPVETVPGRFGTARTAPGQNGGAATVLALTALGGAAQSANRSTEDYRTRLGMDPVGGVGGDIVARTAGVLSDFGANLLDVPVGLANATGLTDIRPFGSMFNDTAGNYKPNYATDKGGLAVRPDAEQEKQNAGWYEQQAANLQRDFEQRAAAARATAGTPDATTAASPSATTTPAATGAAPAPSAATQLASLPATAPVAPAAMPAVPLTPEQAQASNVAGTAVINGRMVAPDEIARLANRNVVSSQAFTNPAVGTLFSEANGGRTPTTEEALALRERMNGGNAASMLAQAPGQIVIPGSGSSGGGIGGRNPGADRTATVNKLMSDISSALGSGKRRTARELIGQLSAYNQVGNTDANLADARSGRNGAAAAKAPKTPVEQALELAQLQEASGRAEGTQLSNAQAKLSQQLQQAVIDATTPAARKAATEKLAALSGKEPPKRNLSNIRVPIGDGLDARNLELPIDTETGQFVIPDGFMDLVKPPAKQGQASAKN